MYVLYWYSEGVHSVGGTYKDIIALARQLEALSVEFKISNGSSYLDQASCGYGGYRYWLNPKASFGMPSVRT